MRAELERGWESAVVIRRRLSLTAENKQCGVESTELEIKGREEVEGESGEEWDLDIT